MKNEELIVYTDGGSRGNPGPAACAFVVSVRDEEIFRGSKYLGRQTNNNAEYSAVILALEWLVNSPIVIDSSQITFYLDSELVVKQINGLYKVKDENIKILFIRVNKLIKLLNVKVKFIHIPREKNKVADLLVNQELDKRH